MTAHMRLDCTCEAEHHSIVVDFNIRYYTGDWFNTPLLFRVNSPTISVV